MNITVSQAQGRVPVTVIQVEGQMDGQNYRDLIDKAQELFKTGARDFLLDLSQLTYISSAGLVALHSVALLASGETPPDTSQGWKAMKDMDRGKQAGTQKHVKLLNPKPEVGSVLEMVGFTQMFDVFSDKDKALKSF
jgi:anti-anti-sigma regulatory factor